MIIKEVDGVQSNAAAAAHVLGLSGSSDDEDEHEGVLFIKEADDVQSRGTCGSGGQSSITPEAVLTGVSSES